VKRPGLDCETWRLAGDVVPLVQDSNTVTEDGLPSEKVFATTNPPLFSTLTIVHVPVDSAAEHVPVDVYPSGIGDSVAVHVGSPE
jgi:hypothetical protein